MKQGKIIIDGEISDESADGCCSLLDVISQVKSQGDCDEYLIYINSVGGSVYAGVNIVLYLIETGKKLITIGGKIVASIATVIFMAGHERFIHDDTDFMIHLPYVDGEIVATADVLKVLEKELRDIEKFLINFYSERTGLSNELISALLQSDCWLLPEHVEALGIASIKVKTPIVAKATSSNKKYFKK